MQGRLAHAARLFGAASHVPDPAPPMFFRVERDSDAAAARDRLGDAAFEAAFEAAFKEGQALTTDQAIVLALHGRPRSES